MVHIYIYILHGLSIVISPGAFSFSPVPTNICPFQRRSRFIQKKQPSRGCDKAQGNGRGAVVERHQGQNLLPLPPVPRVAPKGANALRLLT